MTYLKIDKGLGKYSINGKDWSTIDEINRDSLLTLLELCLGDDFEMDEYKKEDIKNPAHQIIYSNIFEKLNDLSQNKERFKDESESLYKSSLEKYSV